jgi:hypothetical protein
MRRSQPEVGSPDEWLRYARSDLTIAEQSPSGDVLAEIRANGPGGRDARPTRRPGTSAVLPFFAVDSAFCVLRSSFAFLEEVRYA